jgi:hypothetical protein
MKHTNAPGAIGDDRQPSAGSRSSSSISSLQFLPPGRRIPSSTMHFHAYRLTDWKFNLLTGTAAEDVNFSMILGACSFLLVDEYQCLRCNIMRIG